MAKPHKIPADQAQWEAAEKEIRLLYAANGIPAHMIPSRPLRMGNPNVGNFGSLSDVTQFIARARAGMPKVRLKAIRQGQWQDPDAPAAVPEQPLEPWRKGVMWDQWVKAQQAAAEANAKAQGMMWGALGNNPALWQQMQAAQMGPMADFFWNKFPQQMNDIGNIIGEQLNRNADRYHNMEMARSMENMKNKRLSDTLAALKDIYGGFSGALEGGLGSLGQGLGQWGQGFSPLGGASGGAGVGGGGGFRILPNGSVVTAQDLPGAIPEARDIRGRQVAMGPIAGVNAAAANELGQVARGAGRQAAGRIRGEFTAKAKRQGDAARAALMGAGARANQGQLANALLAARGTNRNILSDARAKATVQKANNQARAARGKQFAGIVSQLGGLLPKIG